MEEGFLEGQRWQFFSACDCEAALHLQGLGRRHFKMNHSKSPSMCWAVLVLSAEDKGADVPGGLLPPGSELTDQGSRSEWKGRDDAGQAQRGHVVSSTMKLTEWWGGSEGGRED